MCFGRDAARIFFEFRVPLLDDDYAAYISAVYGQYVAPAPKLNISHNTVSHIMSTLVPYFFLLQSVGHI